MAATFGQFPAIFRFSAALGLDLDSMKDMVTYFRRILIERSKK